MPDNNPPNDQNNQNQNQNQNPPDEKQKEIDRLLAENQNLRKASKDTETKVQSISEELNNLKKQGLRGSEDWKKLAETHEQEAKTYKEKHETSSTAFVGYLQSSRVKEEALKLGLLPEAVSDIDSLSFDEVQVAIEGNKYNVKGAEVAAQNLKKLRPHWFKSEKAPNFNAGANGGAAPTQAEGVEQAKEKYQAALKTRHKDPEGYAKAYKEYEKALLEARKAK